MHSQNGWKVLEPGHTRKWVVPDTDRHLILAPGAAGFLLCHLALWFHEAVEPLDGGSWDDWGYARRTIRGNSLAWSNHASGTAIDLNAQSHPLGARRTFNGLQESRIRARLDVFYESSIRWGGDYKTRADEMHFELVAGPATVLALSHRLRNSPRGQRVVTHNPGNAR